MNSFWLCFVPLFVAVDAIGVLPMFVALTEGIEEQHRKRILYQSVITAIIVTFIFLFSGTWLLDMLGMTVADFMVAGGVLLFAISMSDLLSSTKRQRRVDPESLGAVPIGMPLIAGPAVLTTSILLSGTYGKFTTAAAVLVNILIAGVVFYFSAELNSVLGKSGAKTLSKMSSLLLATIGVMMVRKGIIAIIAMP